MRTCSHPEPGKRREVATAVAAKTREIRTTEFFNKYDITDEEKALPEAEVYPGGVSEEFARNAYSFWPWKSYFCRGFSLGKREIPCRAEEVLHLQQLEIVRAIS